MCWQAVEAKKERESKGKQQHGAKGVKDRVGPQQEKGIWLTLVDHLQRQDKLPVVAFTLSRNRCDQVSVWGNYRPGNVGFQSSLML